MTVAAGVPALGLMLIIAGVALILGLGALWLSRRHTHRERAAAQDGIEPSVERPVHGPVATADPPVDPPG